MAAEINLPERHIMEYKTSALSRIAFIGNYLPRQCGIATFTTDLCEGFSAAYPETACIAVPVNDIEEGYDYPPRVRFELSEKDIETYRSAADFLNNNNVDVVSLQHEYGIFGGRAGSHILTLLHELQMPIVTTLHTVLQNPDPDQRWVMEDLATLSDRMVVMSARAAKFLKEIYKVPAEKIDIIPHGIPDVPFVDPAFHKDQFDVEGKTVLLTFGLLSPNKGIENVIQALPSILEVHPNVVYIMLGATHPQVKRQEGEAYRQSLERLAQELGVADHVIFYNRFVSLEELVNFIGAADIYITPYLNQAQIVSGTLAYAVGAGKAVISTPYWYAEEVLADERGRLVPFRDPQALADKVIELLDNEAMRHAMRKRAYLFGRDMVWPQVARRYRETFERAREEHRCTNQKGFTTKALKPNAIELPALNLNHLIQMTDGTGMLQHANFTVPNYHEGYTVDDNARALIISIMLEGSENEKAQDLASRYLAFISYAFNRENGRFRNFMGFQRNWLEDIGSDDSHGRVLWALGYVVGRSSVPAFQAHASHMFESGLPAILEIKNPRAWAFALLGIYEYLQRYSGDRMANQVCSTLADRLLRLYQGHRADDWRWFEDRLTYCNAALSHALIISGHWLSNQEMVEAGLEALRWLCEVQKPDPATNYFVPIGSSGFYSRGGERARFDQQPVEASTTISACIEAYRVTAAPLWLKEANHAFEWYLGVNDLNLSLYDPRSGGCRDGLHPDRPNENQGAESTLAFLQSLLELKLTEDALQPVEVLTV
jgi:glycosyltransferase involved in cell wall biosynthesis